jgi:hypothetical protein
MLERCVRNSHVRLYFTSRIFRETAATALLTLLAVSPDGMHHEQQTCLGEPAIRANVIAVDSPLCSRACGRSD